MAISTNGTVIARLAGGLYNTVMSNATYLEVASQDPSTLANTLYARDFAKSTDLAVATTLLANLGLASQAGLDAWVAAQLTAAGAANKGAKIVSLLNDFAGLASDATWGTYATSFNTKVDAALAASQKTGSVEAKFEAAGAVAVVAATNATFTLTTGVDSGALFTGGAGNDTFTANNAALGTLDSIAGGDGTDTLTISDSVDIPLMNITAVGIETVNATSTAGSVGSVGSTATIAAKQKINLDLSKLSTATAGNVILNVGGVQKAIAIPSGLVGDATFAAAVAAQIEAVLDDAFGATVTYATVPSAALLQIVSGTAGVALPSISFVASTAGKITYATGYTTATAGDQQANQTTTAAVAASTFSIPADVTTATISAATSAKVASVTTAVTKVTGTDVTLSGGASQTVTAAGSVYASGTKGAIVITDSAKPATGFYVATSSTTGLSGGWGTDADNTVAGALITGGTTVSYTNTKAATITAGVASSGNSAAVQVGSAANKSSAGSATGTDTIRNSALSPTGDVTVSTKNNYTDSSGFINVAFGGGTAKVYTNGGTSVSVTGAAATTIVDIGTTTLIPSTGLAAVAGTSKLTSVTLNGLSGDASITSDAISTVTVTDTLGARTIYNYNSGTTGANSGAINLVVSNVGKTGAGSLVLNNQTATSVNISTAAASAYEYVNGTASTDASNAASKSFVTVTAPKATSVTMTNALSVELGNVVTTSPLVGTINASGATGAVTTIIGAATAYGMAFTGGSGKDSVTLTGDLSVTATTIATSVNLGSGDDKLLNSTSTAATTTFTGASFNGGDGTDTVGISLLTIGNASKFTNFETLGLDVATASSVDLGILAGITGYSLLATGASTSTTYTGAVQANALTVGTSVTSSGTTVLDFGTTVAATTDAYTIKFAPTGAVRAADSTTTNAGIVTITGIEAVTIESGGSGFTTNTIALKDANARTLTITGAQKSSITFDTAFGTVGTSTTSAGVSLIDASAATAKVTINTTNVKTAYAGLSIKGGSGDDAITLADQSDNGASPAVYNGRVTVDAGAGDDVITTKAKSATLTGGSGKDSFIVSLTKAGSDYATAPEITTITDFAAGDTITMGGALYVSTKTTGAANVTNATSLLDAFAKALTPTTGSAVASNTATWFVYGADTYIVANDTVSGYSADDIVVKLTGVASTTLAYAGSTTGIIGAA